MLEGQTYTKDIFEPNPPMIFYLSMPAIVFSKLTHLTMLDSLRIYIISLSFISLTACYALLRKLFNDRLIYLLAYSFVFILLFLPAHQFAQREHLLLILTLPYFLVTALRLENKNLSLYWAIPIGLIAGLGFSIKPHFLTAFVLVEVYKIYARRSIKLDPESICISTVVFTYLVTTLFLYPEYINTVLPIWLPYYKAIQQPWNWVLLDQTFLFCCIVISFFILTSKIYRYSPLGIVLVLATSGFLCSYLIPRVNWYYHILPALSLACLLSVLISWMLISYRPKLSKIMITFMIAIIMAFPLSLSFRFYKKNIIQFANLDTTRQKLISFLNQNYPDNSFNIYSITHDLNILAYYTKATYVGNFQFLTWEYNRIFLKYASDETALHYQAQKMPYCIEALANNLKTEKPRFIIVDFQSAQEYLHLDFDFIREYSEYPSFKDAWNSYQFLSEIDHLKIYERMR